MPKRIEAKFEHKDLNVKGIVTAFEGHRAKGFGLRMDEASTTSRFYLRVLNHLVEEAKPERFSAIEPQLRKNVGATSEKAKKALTDELIRQLPLRYSALSPKHKSEVRKRVGEEIAKSGADETRMRILAASMAPRRFEGIPLDAILPEPDLEEGPEMFKAAAELPPGKALHEISAEFGELVSEPPETHDDPTISAGLREMGELQKQKAAHAEKGEEFLDALEYALSARKLVRTSKGSDDERTHLSYEAGGAKMDLTFDRLTGGITMTSPNLAGLKDLLERHLGIDPEKVLSKGLPMADISEKELGPDEIVLDLEKIPEKERTARERYTDFAKLFRAIVRPRATIASGR